MLKDLQFPLANDKYGSTNTPLTLSDPRRYISHHLTTGLSSALKNNHTVTRNSEENKLFID